MTDFVTYTAKKIAIADTAVGAEHSLPNVENERWQENQADEKQADEQRRFFCGDLSS